MWQKDLTKHSKHIKWQYTLEKWEHEGEQASLKNDSPDWGLGERFVLNIGGEIGWTSVSESGVVTASVTCPRLFPPDNDVFGPPNYRKLGIEKQGSRWSIKILSEMF